MKYFHFHKLDLKKGIVFVLLAWFSFTSMYMISKLIEPDTSVPTILFFRNVMGLVIIAPWIIKGWPKSIKIKNWKIILLRSVVGMLNLLFILLAVQKISLVNTTLLNNAAPFLVPFILWFWLKVPINHKLWPAIVLGFIGIALILQPNMSILNIGSLYGILSAFFLAINLITIRITAKTEQFKNYLLYYFMIGILLIAPFAFFNWKIDNALTLIGLLSLGLFSMVGQFFFFLALQHAKASQLAPFCYSAVIFAGFYEWAIWSVVPKPLAFLGMFIIVGAGVWIVLVSKPPKDKTIKKELS